MAEVFRPKEAMSTRHITPTEKERVKYAKEFREQKDHEAKLKDERFAAIEERRKKGPSGGSGAGINIEVTSDSEE